MHNEFTKTTSVLAGFFRTSKRFQSNLSNSIFNCLRWTICIQFISLNGCSDEFVKTRTKDQRSSSAAIQTRLDESGNTVGSVSNTASERQYLRVGSGKLTGSSIAIPVGALSIPISITVGPGDSLVNSEFTNSIGLGDNQPASSGPAVSFLPSSSVSAANPFTLSIPISITTTLGLSRLLELASGTNYSVIYHCEETVNGSQSFYSGVIPPSEFVVSGNFVTFQFQKFGTFQVIATPTPIERKIEKQILEAPTLKSAIDFNITDIKPVSANPGETISIIGSAFEKKESKYFDVQFTTLSGEKIRQRASIVSDSQLTFSMPNNLGLGQKQFILLNSNSARVTTFKLIANSASNDLAIVLGSSDNICSGQSYIDGLTGTIMSGTRNCSPLSACSSDNQTNCLSTASYPAVDFSKVSPEKIKTGTTIAGIAGSIPATIPNCTSDNGTLCTTTASYKSVEKALLDPSKFKSTTTIGGIAGTLTPPATCDGTVTTGCLATASFPASQNCTSEGESNCFIPQYNGSTQHFKAINYDTLNSSYYMSDTTIAGKVGTISNCAAENTSGCYVQGSYLSFSSTALSPGVIKSGVTILGVTGDYPSVAYPLAGADGTSDLDTATFNAKIKSGAPFEYFDSGGNRYTGNGSPAVMSASNFLSGVDVFGTVGTLSWASNPWEFASGLTSNGQIGLLKRNCRNNFPTSGASGWEGTFDDYNNNSVIPVYTSTYSGWGEDKNCDTLASNISDSGVWLDVTTLGDGMTSSNCTATPTHCTYLDKITGKQWQQNLQNAMWPQALETCDNLNYNGQTDWRLPTQKEVLTAYIHGIRTVGPGFPWLSSFLWSATSTASSVQSAVTINPSVGNSTSYSKTFMNNFICVRP
ncbi:MAG: DUF1566 domain-containing protein [Proteobacteria bacterium]|nr:DUF1566 domain-containing protein [Pseudomonadota bacterium]